MTCHEVRHLSQPPSVWQRAGLTPPHEHAVRADELVIQHPRARGCRCDPTLT